MTDAEWKEMTWNQFGAALDMFTATMRACPDELWQARLWTDAEFPMGGEFWIVAFHTIKWLDFYTSESYDHYEPAMLITRADFENDDWRPDRVYTKAELETFLERARSKTKQRIMTLDDPMEIQDVRRSWIDMSVAELILYTMRHVMEHEGNLSMLLGQHGIQKDWWVSREGVAQE